MGAAGTVLLKNVNGTLPLLQPRSLVLVGSDAGPAKKGPNGHSDRGGLDGSCFLGPTQFLWRADGRLGILAQGSGSGYVEDQTK